MRSDYPRSVSFLSSEWDARNHREQWEGQSEIQHDLDEKIGEQRRASLPCPLMLSEVDGRLGRAALSAYRLRQPRNLQRYRIDCTLERIASAGRALIPDKAAEHRGATVKLMMRV